MKNLFWAGLRNEAKMIQKANLGYSSYIELLRDIDESEELFIRKAYAHYLRQIADDYLKRRHKDRRNPPVVVEYLLELASLFAFEKGKLRKRIPPELVEKYKEGRVELIRLGIRNNIPIPPLILSQYPPGFFDADWQGRSRVDKATWTAENNHTGNEDYSLYLRFGMPLRRQDGKPLRHSEREQIAAGMEELTELFGDLPMLIRSTGLTMIHTGGKKILHSNLKTYGSYLRLHQTLALGVNQTPGNPSMVALGHELIGHWLDHSSVISQPKLDLLPIAGKPLHRITLSISFLDASLLGEKSILCKAIETMNPVHDIRGEQLAEFVQPSEVFARLCEQYLSIRLYRKGRMRPVSVRTLDEYHDSQGFWIMELWNEGLFAAVHQQIEARLELARLANGIPEDTPFTDLLFPELFYWLG